MQESASVNPIFSYVSYIIYCTTHPLWQRVLISIVWVLYGWVEYMLHVFPAYCILDVFFLTRCRDNLSAVFFNLQCQRLEVVCILALPLPSPDKALLSCILKQLLSLCWQDVWVATVGIVVLGLNVFVQLSSVFVKLLFYRLLDAARLNLMLHIIKKILTVGSWY